MKIIPVTKNYLKTHETVTAAKARAAYLYIGICLSVLVVGFMFFTPQAVKMAFPSTITAGTIERSQEILQEDKDLRQRIEREEKVFIKKVIIKGALKLSREEIRDIILPFENQWLTKKDIQRIIDSLKSAYQKKGIETSHFKPAYELKKAQILEITLNELTQ